MQSLNTINVPSSNTTAQTAIEPTEESDDNGTTNDLTEDSEDDAAESNQSDIDDDPNWTPGKASHSSWGNFLLETSYSALLLSVLEHP